MRLTSLTLLAAASLLFGCSKKSAPQPEATTATAPTAAVPSKEDNAMIAAALEDLNRKIQQQQYDAAVGSLVTLSRMPKSDAEEAKFRARLRETETALNQRAVQGDPAAQQSAQMLGRMITGR
jgi:PBP1b-binding outer membrane lipoprotein LpoB